MTGQDSVVSIATRYWLNTPGIESRCGARISAPAQAGPGAYTACYKMGTGSFPRGEAAGPLASSTEVKENVELYVYSPLHLHGWL